ncbi:MAG: hypothetical protein JJT90_15355 [Ectothiorhodospiraceae bacterium]|nr:hypothetical protein [Ectothiorhodospiraceae bacterium]
MPEQGLFTPERKMASIAYICYLLGFFTGGFSSLVAVVIAYVFRGDAAEALRSHYRFQIRTFWIGLLLVLVGSVLSVILIGVLVLLFGVVWLVVRCVVGLKYLNAGEAVPNPGSWLFGIENRS